MSATDATTGLISFVPSYGPALPDGDYEVIVAQRVTDTPPPNQTAVVNETFVNRRRLRVEGPQYALRPDEVAAVFPPPDGRGEYESVLPHVVLARKSLAWERTPHPDGSADGTPWLAVLVFAESDAHSGEPAPWGLQSIAVSNLRAPAPGIVTYPAPALPPVGEGDERCQVIDVPVELWRCIAPTLAELALLAHGRELTGETTDETCVVVANRLPQPNERNIAHLVSVEGLAPLLPGGLALPAGGHVRLVSLRSWSFTSEDPAETFTGYLEGLSPVGPLALAPQPAPSDPTDAVAGLVHRAVTMGYAPQNHRTRSGDRTVSFYRGPLIPYVPGSSNPLPAGTAPARIDSAEELLRYDTDTGMLDVSLAAAWQLGRLLLLADTGVASALTAWRNDNLIGAATALERAVLAERLGAYLDLSETDGASSDAVLAAGRATLATLDLRPVAPPSGASTPADRAAWFRGDTADALAALVRDPVTWSQSGLLTAVPPEVTAWFARLRLLYGVPAAYLVPDASMLAPESLATFTVDADWTRALFDGAFSVGRTSRLHADHDAATPVGILGGYTPVSGELAESTSLSGFLLNSRVVAGWPQLEVRAFDTSSRLPMVRMERLGPSLLFFLAAGTIASFEVAEAPQGLHFGMLRTSGFTKPLRPATPNGSAPATASVTVPFRPDAAGVVDIAGLETLISAAVYTPAADPGQPASSPSPLSASQFAWQMVEGSQSVRFSIDHQAEPAPAAQGA